MPPTTNEDPRLLITEHPATLKSDFLNFSRADKRFCGGAFFVLIIVQTLAGGWTWLLVLTAWIACLLQINNGRLYYVFGQECIGWWRVYVRKGVTMEKKPEAASAEGAHKKQRPPLIRGPSRVIPFDVHSVGEDIALLHYELADAIVIRADGSGIPGMTLREQHDTQAHLLADALTRTAAQFAVPCGISWVFCRRPLDMAQVYAYQGTNLNPQVAIPPDNPVTPAEKRAAARHKVMVQELPHVMNLTCSQADMLMVVTVRRDQVLQKAYQKQSLAQSAVGRLAVVRAARVAVEGLAAAGVKNPRPLDRDEIHRLVRRSWDVANLGDYYSWRANTDEEIGFSPLLTPQESVLEFDDHCVFDGTFHSVVRITGVPARVYPHTLRELLYRLPRWTSFALVGETISTTREQKFRNRAEPTRRNFRMAIGKTYQTPKEEDEDEARHRRHREVTETPFKQNFVLLNAVSATSKDELDGSVDDVLSAIRTLGMSGEHVKGAGRQRQALLAATLGLPHLL